MGEVPAGARYTVEPLRPRPRRVSQRPVPNPMPSVQRRRTDDWVFGLLLGGWLFGSGGS